MARVLFGDGVYWIKSMTSGGSLPWSVEASNNGKLWVPEPTLSGIEVKYGGSTARTYGGFTSTGGYPGLDIYSLGNQHYISEQVKSAQESITGLDSKIDAVMDAVGSGVGGSSVDYSPALVKVQQLLAWTDVLLIVLLVMLVVFAGVFVGSLVTRWLRNRS